MVVMVMMVIVGEGNHIQNNFIACHYVFWVIPVLPWRGKFVKGGWRGRFSGLLLLLLLLLFLYVP